MTRPTLRILVTSPPAEGGLGYCCPYFFFKRFRRTGLVAARLGVTDRAVQIAKSRIASGEWVCEKRETCMKALLTR
jgi:hypothetical protein